MRQLLWAVLLAASTPVVADESSFSYPLTTTNQWRELRIESAVGCKQLGQTLAWLNTTSAVKMSASPTLLPRGCEYIRNNGAAMSVSIRLITASDTGKLVYKVAPSSTANFNGTFYVFDVKTETF